MQRTHSNLIKDKTIPQFFEKIPSVDDSVAFKVREDARAMFLQNMSKDAIESDELQKLWEILEKSSPPPLQGQSQMINYCEFLRIKASLDPQFKARKYFTAKVFGKVYDSDENGRINIYNFFSYVMRKIWLRQTRVALSLYDSTGQGFLTETNLENYIQELIPTLCRLDSLDKQLYPFYTCIAVRKFFFFLDPYRYNTIKILDILGSGFLDDLLELRDEDLSKNREESNWFSETNTLRLYSAYLRMDTDHNGMLSKTELYAYSGGNLTSIFIDRIFDTCITYDKEIDFKTYVDIVLALENRKEPQSLYFFFNIFDIKGEGFIDTFCLNYFFKGIQNHIKSQGQEPLNFDDICNEIFDMIAPEIPGKISFNDFVSCGNAETIVNILIDINGFWAYENREAQLIEIHEEAEV